MNLLIATLLTSTTTSAEVPKALEIYKCFDPVAGKAVYTSNPKDLKRFERCALVSREIIKVTPAQRYANDPKYRQLVDSYRAGLKVGDRTTSGLIVEIKEPLVLVQQQERTKWFRRDDIFPP
jgi:hypothetical protein